MKKPYYEKNKTRSHNYEPQKDYFLFKQNWLEQFYLQTNMYYFFYKNSMENITEIMEVNIILNLFCNP